MEIYPENAVVLAPLAGHSDLPMRLSARRHSCRYAFTEMIDAGSLVFGNHKSQNLSARGETEDFLGVQLVGSDTGTLKKACEIINGRDYSVLDFNLGCPAPKVERKCEGIALALKRPDDAVRALETLTSVSRIPVTVKTRILDKNDPAPTIAFIRRLTDAGAQGITLHGRVMKDFYSGVPEYGIIRAVRENCAVPLVANGGIMDIATYRTMREATGCSRVMIARGALGNPWVFAEVSDPDYVPPTVSELADELERHISDMIDFYGEKLTFQCGRKTILEYLRGRGYPGTLRAKASVVANKSDFAAVVDEVRRGPAEGYWAFLEKEPGSPRRIRKN